MTIIESGVFSGIPTGAIIGGTICKVHGVIGVLAGSLAGMVSGAVAGLIYSFLIMALMSLLAVLWRSARKRARTVSDADMEVMSRIGVRGAFIGILATFICWFSFAWLHAVAVAFAAAAGTALIGVGRSQFR